MRTKTLLITLIIVLAVSSCQKQIDKLNQSQAEETASRRGGPGNNSPVADAGVDITIVLPVNSVILNGSGSYDADNNIRSYLWTKISGPSSFSIANANALQTQVTNLAIGVYTFELKVTDRTKLVDRDTVQVTVNTQPPPCTTCKIVFVSDRDDNGNSDIYSCNADGSNVIRLTNDPGDDGQPAWSPDGTRIAFTSNRDGYAGVYIMNADGSNVEQRTFSVDPNVWIMGLTWSPDGMKIAYSENAYVSDDSYEVRGIYVVGATSGSPLPLFGDGENPAWSPDGTKIALGAFVNNQDIYTINADGTGFTPLTTGINSGYDAFNYPSWSPNGAKLAMVFAQTSTNYVPHISVMNSDGSGFTLLASSAAWAGTSWSGDGTIIVFTSQSESGSMWNVSWVAANGSAAGTIITNGWDADWQH